MDLTQWIFFGPAKLIAIWPYAGIAIAIALMLIQVAFNLSAGAPFNQSFFRKAPVFAGLLWLIFGFYERQMQAVMVLSAAAASVATKTNAETTLRLDLIVLTPILYLLSAAAILQIWRTIKVKLR